MTDRHMTYRRSFTATFNAVREIEETPSGYEFKLFVVFEADTLDEGCVVHPSVVHRIVDFFDKTNLNQLLHPMIPTLENIAKAAGQVLLDHLFKAEQEGDVRLLLVRITATDGNSAEVVYTY